MRMNATSGGLGICRPNPYVSLVAAPAPMTVLFDGNCPFCSRSAHAIQQTFGKERIALCDFQQAGALDAYPAVTRDAAVAKMHVVMPDGRVYAGAEAFARIAISVPLAGWPAWLYYVPGVKQIADATYALVAKYRYRLFGRKATCDTGTCRVHGA
jgi:predicted DCC family thiol-disulfide oxidoreductase YuxK